MALRCPLSSQLRFLTTLIFITQAIIVRPRFIGDNSMSRNRRHKNKGSKQALNQFASQAAAHGPIKPKKSLGMLRKANKTKPRSPNVTGKLTLQRHTLTAIVKDLEQNGGDEVICNIAGWVNRDQLGQYLTVELSPRFVPYEQQTPKRGIFDSFINQDE